MESKNEVTDEIERHQNKFKSMNPSEIIPLGADEKIEEIAIRKLCVLSDFAMDEVFKKLDAMTPPFNFRGYVKISYGGSPLRTVSVDPIEGSAIDYVANVITRVLIEKQRGEE